MAVKKKSNVKKAAAKTAAKGKRYSKAEKARILAFVGSEGRGGQAKAAKKFGVSPLTISNWRKAGGDGESGKPKAAAKGDGDPWTRMVAIKKDIDLMEDRLAAKRKELRKLASQL